MSIAIGPNETKFVITNPNDEIQQYHVAGHFYEEEELNFIEHYLREHLPANHQPIIVDVGANIGNHTLYFDKFLNPKAVYAIEPNCAALRILRQNILLNECTTVNTDFVEFGLGDAAYCATVQPVQENNMGVAQLKKEVNGTVKIVAGDVFFKDIAIDLIKIDVEGMEIKVLAGLRQTIANARPLICIEIDNANLADFEAFCTEHRYAIVYRKQRYTVNETFLIAPLPKYSIVIPTYNHCDDLLKPCLESIEKYTSMAAVEVIVVANGCTDNTREYVTGLGHPYKLIWMEDPEGYTIPTNVGIKAATGEFVVLLNNDTVMLDQPMNMWLDWLVTPFTDDKTGVTGPVKFSWDCGGLNRTAMAFWLVMIRRSLFDKIGILDEAFSPGMGEDGDFCIRAEQAGYKLVSVPDNVTGEFELGIVNLNFPIWHKGNGTFADDINSKDEIITRNIKILADRYGVQPKISIVIPTYNHFDDAFKECIDNVLKYTDLSDKEIIVVANGCTDGTEEYLYQLGDNITFIWEDSPIGFVRAINAGIAQAKGKYIVTLDNDSILMPQEIDTWINILLQPFLNTSDCGASSPFANVYENMGLVLHSGCTMYDASLLKRIGMFDEIYNPGYFSDSDVAMKIWRAGFKCVEVPSSQLDKKYNDGMFEINFPVIHTGLVQTMNKNADIKIVEKNREILYSRYGKPKMDQLAEAYNWCLLHPSDINEHFPTLRKYASQCDHITEFGTRDVFSTYAFMSAKPKTLITYDINVPATIWTADAIAKENNISFAFMERDTLTCEIEKTDLLFIDTKHTYEQLHLELNKHCNNVNKYIILHDTVSFGTIGEDGGHGLLPAVDDFLMDYPEWKIREHYFYNNGLMILEKSA